MIQVEYTINRWDKKNQEWVFVATEIRLDRAISHAQNLTNDKGIKHKVMKTESKRHLMGVYEPEKNRV